MSKKLFAFISALAVAAAPAAAQASVLVRVSGKGADAAGCGTAAAPCRTLQAAHDQVDAGGYIVAVDPADFGGVVVTKSVTIANESAGAARITGPAAVDMKAPGATVRLHGMTIEAEAWGVAGRADWLDVADCVVNGSFGISTYEGPGYSDPRITLLNTSFSRAGFAVYGMSKAMFAKNTRFNGVVYLFKAWTSVFEDSFVENPQGGGSNFAGIRIGDAFGVLRNTVVRDMPIGIYADSSRFLLGRSTFTGNQLAFQKSAQQHPMIQSAGDNIIRGNTDDALGVVTPAALH